MPDGMRGEFAGEPALEYFDGVPDLAQGHDLPFRFWLGGRIFFFPVISGHFWSFLPFPLGVEGGLSTGDGRRRRVGLYRTNVLTRRCYNKLTGLARVWVSGVQGKRGGFETRPYGDLDQTRGLCERGRPHPNPLLGGAGYSAGSGDGTPSGSRPRDGRFRMRRGPDPDGFQGRLAICSPGRGRGPVPKPETSAARARPAIAGLPRRIRPCGSPGNAPLPPPLSRWPRGCSRRHGQGPGPSPSAGCGFPWSR